MRENAGYLSRFGRLGAIVVLAIPVFAWSVSQEPARAWASLLIAGFYFLCLALGALVFIAIHHLVRAEWWLALRPVPEGMTRFLPWAAGVLLLGLLLGHHELYHWSHADAVQHDPLLAAKAPYLNTLMFFTRMSIILALWVLFAGWIRRLSAPGPASPDSGRKLRRTSAIFLVIFAISFSVASFDWLMSLEPHWFSTIYAVYCFAGLLQGVVAAITVATVRLYTGGQGRIGERHLHDCGKLLFAFSTFWAYIWLSQYLLIWYGNIPEEVTHYVVRTGEDWRGLFLLNLGLNWVLPFLLLLPRATKVRPPILLGVATIVLLGRWLDIYLLVMPAVSEGPRFGLLEPLAFLAVGALFLMASRGPLGARPVAS